MLFVATKATGSAAANSQLSRFTAVEFRNRSVQRRSVQLSAQSADNLPEIGSKVEKWMKTPFDILALGPRAGLGALVSLPDRMQTLRSDVDRVMELLQDPRPVDVKQQVVLREVEDTLVEFLEKGTTLEIDVRENLKTVLPSEVVKQLEEIIPEPPNTPKNLYEYEETDEVVVTYTAESVAANQMASEMQELKIAVSAVKDSLDGIKANVDPSKTSMLKLNLKEARDLLSRRLSESTHSSPSDTTISAAVREARILLEEVNAQFP